MFPASSKQKSSLSIESSIGAAVPGTTTGDGPDVRVGVAQPRFIGRSRVSSRVGRRAGPAAMGFLQSVRRFLCPARTRGDPHRRKKIVMKTEVGSFRSLLSRYDVYHASATTTWSRYGASELAWL